MKKAFTALLAALFLLLCSCAAPEPMQTAPSTGAAVPPILLPESLSPEEVAKIPAAEAVLDLTDKEKEILLKIGMSERGLCGCPECIALVMCTILNRVDSPKFGSTIAKVVLSPEQFTPVANGTYYRARPNEQCYDALEMVLYGWDESQGALYYEWCEGESWHSKNLNLLFQHCDIRFYD